MTRSPRIARALLSLDGLSIGDAFGEWLLQHPREHAAMLGEWVAPPAPWRYTDDTAMALGVVEVLAQKGKIDQDALANAFAARLDQKRGYSLATAQLLAAVRNGGHWRDLAPRLFGGRGSGGNGAAMRVAPLGGFFADDPAQAAAQAALQAAVTHSHDEGIAGAMAVALAAAWSWRIGQGAAPAYADLLDLVLAYLPHSAVRDGLERAQELSPGAPPQTAAAVLGNGANGKAQDTVPFAVWCAASNLRNFDGALWAAARGFGGTDTLCAITGGIVALCVGAEGIPATWRAAREPLPDVAGG